MKTIDCRKLDCPAPVINVKKALEGCNEIRVLLDDGAPRENVTRFARNRGFRVIEQQGENSEWSLTLLANTDDTTPSNSALHSGNRILLITSDKIGDGSEELGRLLMKNFIHTLIEIEDLPSHMIFLNSGVYLTCEGSDTLEALEKLFGIGVDILSCGLCLDYYKLKEKLRVGTVTNMLATTEQLLDAGSVIKL